MAQVVIRNLPDEVHRAIRVRAKLAGRSTEAEIREILGTAVEREGRLRLGSLLVDIGREAGLSDGDVAHVTNLRDGSPAEPIAFE